MALLEETAFRNSVEAIFLANVGSLAMALTCHAHGAIPDIAPTTPSRPTVPVSMVLPSRITTRIAICLAIAAQQAQPLAACFDFPRLRAYTMLLRTQGDHRGGSGTLRA